MKPSLWDLKHAVFKRQHRISVIMKPSLWDLKLQQYRYTIKKRKNHETIPMGFETQKVEVVDRIVQDHETIPMGFETKPSKAAVPCVRIMKPSLWDLKPPR